jgi:hypothetical protein
MLSLAAAENSAVHALCIAAQDVVKTGKSKSQFLLVSRERSEKGLSASCYIVMRGQNE